MNEITKEFYTVDELAKLRGCTVSTLRKSLNEPRDAEFWLNSELVGVGNQARWEIDIGDGNAWRPRLQGYHGQRSQGGRKMVSDD